jgi:hypothetical protein
MGEKRNVYRILVGEPEVPEEDQDRGGVEWTGLVWSGSGEGPLEVSCECGNDLKCWEILEWLCNWWLIEQCSAA